MCKQGFFWEAILARKGCYVESCCFVWAAVRRYQTSAKKNPSKLKTGLGRFFSWAWQNRPPKHRFFIWWVRPTYVIKNRADDLWEISQVHRLCVYASGSLMTVMCSFSASIKHSRLHFGQKSGKFSRMVSSRIFIRVLQLQAGHKTQSSLPNDITPIC